MSPPELYYPARYEDPFFFSQWRGVERYVDRALQQELRFQLDSLHEWVRHEDPLDPNHPEYPFAGGTWPRDVRELLNKLTEQDTFGHLGELRTMSATDAMRIFNLTLYNNPGIKIGPDRLLYEFIEKNHIGKSVLFDTPAEQDPEVVSRSLVSQISATFRRMTEEEGAQFDEHNPFTVVYVGDGNGITRKYVSGILEREHPEIFSVLSNTCVDSGSTMRTNQEKNRVEGVREEFLSDSVVNMKHIADRSVRGVVYLMEVLDDAAPSTWIQITDSGDLEEIRFAWDVHSYRRDDYLYPKEVIVPVLQPSVESILFNYMCYDKHPMANSVGVPVSPYIPLIMAEINRIMISGSVFMVDYAGGFMAPDKKLAYGINNVPVRWVLTSEQAVGNYVDYAEDIGSMGVTSDVDPMLVAVSGGWYGFQSSYTGLYASYIAEHVPGYNRNLVKGIMKTRSDNLELYHRLAVSHGIERQKLEFIRGLITNKRRPLSVELERAMMYQMAAGRDKAMDLTYWVTAMNIPINRMS